MCADNSCISKVIKIINLLLLVFLFTSKHATGSTCGSGSRCVLKSFCSNETRNIYEIDSINYRVDSYGICQVCCKKKSIKQPPQQDCGLRNTEGKLIQIVNGMDRETDFPEFPWVVAIFLNSATEHEFLGGGSIVAPNVVLTASHIVFSHQPRELVVRAGEWDIQTEDEPLKHKNCLVLKIIAHEHFNSENAIYDIALLVLQQQLELTHHIRPICLPRSNEFINIQHCFVAGWGKPKFGEQSQIRNIMRAISLPIVNRAECQEKFRQTRLGRYFELHETFMCAGGEKDMDACTGDGGSPLFCPLLDHPNQYFQLGIVSWGLDCHEQNVPGAYADVYFMQKWLRDNLKELNVNPNYYTPSFTRDYYEREMKSKA